MRASIQRESTSSSLNNSKLIRGDTEKIIVRIAGQSLIISNFGFTFTAKIDPNDADSASIIQKTSAAGGGIAVSLPAPNLLEAIIDISSTDTEILMDGDELYYDIQMSTASPKSNRTLDKGRFKIEGDITRNNASPPAPVPPTTP